MRTLLIFCLHSKCVNERIAYKPHRLVDALINFVLYLYNTLCLQMIEETMKSIDPKRQKLDANRITWQFAKQAKLYSDLLQALRAEPLIALSS